MTNATKHIALVCPGGPISRELADNVADIAQKEHGDRVRLHFHDQCFFSCGHFAGTDTERSEALLAVANDPKFDAVWFARGGYGAARLDEQLFTKLNDYANRKTYIGYSDAGFLLARLHKENIGHPVHGPMPTDLPRNNGETAIKRVLEFLVSGDTSEIEPNALSGKPVAAFNITILAHLCGTDWLPDLSGHVIMLEDVAEYLYRIDRAMFTITSNPKIANAAGIRLGRVSDIPENDRPFGESDEELIKNWCARKNIPYLGRADIGHDADNKIVPFGATLCA
ncbi:LD-carboxypeptidase [Hyphococcus sp. DH-69]|uniref:LD-carboxypeptidase n=1 Tax=Hyphococcus formosus TaxID=3143534 RepID=UPI00398AD0D4